MGYSRKELQNLIENTVTPWLVKSSGRVLGPFSKEEVEEKLSTRELVALDEVARPMKRWRYFRDEATFSSLIENVKSKANDNEQTMTSTIDAASVMDELTETAEIDHLTPTEPLDKKGEVYKEKSVYNSSGGDTEETPVVASYGYQGDRNIEKSLSKTSRLSWVITIVAMALVGLFVFTSKKKAAEEVPVDNLSQLVKLGLEARDVGDLELMRKYFRKALALDPKNIEVALKLAPLVIQIDRDLVYARNILRDVLTYQTDPQYLRDANIGMALADLVDHRWDQASEFLSRAEEIDGSFISTLLNRAVYFNQKQNYDAAIRSYDKAERFGNLEGAGPMLAVQALVKKFEKTKDPEFARKALKVIDGFLVKSRDYLQEYLVARAYVTGVLLGQLTVSDIDRILNENPYLDKNHWHEPQVYREHMKWKNLTKWCEKIHELNPQSAKMDGLLALCLIRANSSLEAGQWIESAITKDPNDSLLLALRAFHLIETGNENKGVGILTHILSSDPSKLSLILMGSHCQRPTPEECSEVQWQKLARQHPTSLMGLTYSAEQALKEGRLSDAEKLIRRGLNISPRYRGLLEAKASLEVAKRSAVQ